MPKSSAGIVPLFAAPFTGAGALDDDSFQSRVHRWLHTDALALTLVGLATEFYNLTDPDQTRLQACRLAETARLTRRPAGPDRKVPRRV
jgi:hypothetical protein